MSIGHIKPILDALKWERERGERKEGGREEGWKRKILILIYEDKNKPLKYRLDSKIQGHSRKNVFLPIAYGQIRKVISEETKKNKNTSSPLQTHYCEAWSMTEF